MQLHFALAELLRLAQSVLKSWAIFSRSKQLCKHALFSLIDDCAENITATSTSNPK
jgi:hypothetical protein